MTETAAGRRRLGRGLEALLGPTREEAEREGSLVELAVADIRPNPYQPRRDADPVALEELKASIRRAGLLQPVVVRAARAEGGYELIAGERRLRACQALGWERIPAVRREVDDRTVLTLALIENLQRDDLSPVDEARGYDRLIAEFNLTQQDVAEAVGRDRSTVANALRLLRLPAAVLGLLHEGRLSVGHARALLGLEDPGAATALAKEAVDHGLSVRDVEDRVRGGRAPVRRPRLKKGLGQAPEVRRIEDALRRRLGTDVRVTLRSKGKGHIHVGFYSNDDLARLLELMLGSPFDGLRTAASRSSFIPTGSSSLTNIGSRCGRSTSGSGAPSLLGSRSCFFSRLRGRSGGRRRARPCWSERWRGCERRTAACSSSPAP